MSANNKQNKFNASDVYTDAVARAKNELTADQERKSKHDKKLILLVLLIMFFVITQVIVLLSSSGLNQSPEPVSVSGPEVTLDDIKAVNNDLKNVMKSIDDITTRPEVEVTEAEEKNIEVEKKVTPVTVSPVIVKPAIAKKDKKIPKPQKAVAEVKKSKPAEKKLEVLVPITASNKKETAVTVTEIMPAYIKHDSEGSSLAEDAEQWTCVHDTATGLMWEVKSQDDAMRNSNNLYSWYIPEHKVLPGKSDGGRCKGGTDCDTNAYVQAMNERNYCGHNDWRLPTREQMQTLVDLRNGKEKVKINKQYFPQTMPSWYWTSSDEGNADELAWYVLFRNGFALSDLKERPKHVRLVRKQHNEAGSDSNVY
jgi:Protein of unknown function (DUF1566)